MEITTCPECAAETYNAGLAYWADADEPTVVFECRGEGCGWVGVALEYWSSAAPAAATAA